MRHARLGGLSLALAAALLGCRLAPAAAPDAASRVSTRLPRALERATLIGVDGGTLIGVDAGSLVGVDAGTLLGVDAGSLVGEVSLPEGPGGYRLAAARPAAGIRVYVRDARGRFLYGKDRKLISAVTDATGRFALKGWRAAKGLTFFVPIDAKEGVVRGFSALRPLNQPESLPVRVNDASTMVASWVETRVLKAVPEPEQALDRLTQAVAAAAEQAMARAVVDNAPRGEVDWRADKLADLADTVRAANAPLSEALEALRRVMTLAGVNPCEAGQLASEALLRRPRAVAVTADGAIHLAAGGLQELVQGEGGGVGGLARLVGEPRRLEHVTGPCVPGAEAPAFTVLTAGADGSLFAAAILPFLGTQPMGAAFLTGSIWRQGPGQSAITPWAGGSRGAKPPAIGLPGLELDLTDLSAVTAARGGGVWLAKASPEPQPGGQLVRLDAEGRVAAFEGLPYEAPTFQERTLELRGAVTALAETGDGALWGLQSGVLWRRPAGGAREVRWHDPAMRYDPAVTALLPLPDHDVLLAVSDAPPQDELQEAYVPGSQHRIWRIGPAGPAVVFAGAGPAGPDAEVAATATARFNRPAGLALDRDGSVLVADMDNGLLRRIDPASGRVTVVAGSRDASAVLAREALLDQPRGVAFDQAGRLLVTESGSHTLRRMEGSQLVRLAGGIRGLAGGGEPARATSLDRPAQVAAVGEDVLLVEAGRLLRRYSPASGLIETLTGGGARTPGRDDAPIQAREARWGVILAMTVDAEGRPVFAAVSQDMTSEHPPGAMLWRIEGDGRLTHLGGDGSEPDSASRDGEPLKGVRLGRVSALARGPGGDLFLTEPMPGVVWRLDPQGVLHHVAGRQETLQPDFLTGLMPGVSGGQQGDGGAKDATLAFPAGLACDPAGNVYVAEAGSLGFERMLGGIGLPTGLLPFSPGRVRCLTPDGQARILAGTGAPAGAGKVDTPAAVAADATGRVVLVDLGSGQLLELVAGQR
jgi:hypothetical protein